MGKIKLSLIIPAFNEEKKIAKDIREAFSYFAVIKLKGEVIVSTDGVTDRTNRIVKELQGEYKELRLIAKKEKIGKGAAIKKAVQICRGKYVMFADAGYCVPFKFIGQGLKLLKNYDTVLGSRALSTSKIIVKQPSYRIIGSKIFSLIVHNFLGIPKEIEDTQCGFKLFKRSIANSLFGELKTKEMMFDIELILRIIKNNYKFTTLAVEWSSDSDTKYNPIFGTIRSFWELHKIKTKYKL